MAYIFHSLKTTNNKSQTNKVLYLFFFVIILIIASFSFAQAQCLQTEDRVRVNTIIDTIQIFHYCPSGETKEDFMSYRGMLEDFDVYKKLKALKDTDLPYLVELITSNKDKERVYRGITALAFCGIQAKTHNQIDWSKVYDIRDKYFSNGIYPPSYPDDLQILMQVEIVKQLKTIKCSKSGQEMCCSYIK